MIDERSGSRASRLRESRHPGFALSADRAATISGLVVVGVVLLGLVACLAAVRKGLDLTDESYYILVLRHPQAYLRSPSNFQVLLGPVLAIVHRVWILRAVSLLGLVGAHAYFAWAFLKTAPTLLGARFDRADEIVVGAAIIAGALIESAYLPPTPGYNQMTVFLIVLAAGTLLLLADQRLSRRATLGAWFFAGVLGWCQLLTKWPAMGALLPLSLLALLAPPVRRPRVLRAIAAVLAGVACAALLTQLFLASVPAVLGGLLESSASAAGETARLGHGVGPLLGYYRTDIGVFVRTIGRDFWWLLLVAVAVGVLLSIRRYARTAAAVASVGLVVLALAFVFNGRHHGGSTPYGGPQLAGLMARSSVIPLYLVLALCAAAAAFATKAAARPKTRQILVFGALLVTPFLTAVGTNNPLWLNALYATTFWVAAALAVTRMAFPDGRPLIHGLAIAFAVVIVATAFDGVWHHPYRQPALHVDSAEVNLDGPLQGLQLYPATANLVNDVRADADAIAGELSPSVVDWSFSTPAIAANGQQPFYAWTDPYLATAWKSLETACADRQRPMLFVTFPGLTPDLLHAKLAPSCAARTWTVDAPLVLPFVWNGSKGPVTTLEVQSSPAA